MSTNRCMGQPAKSKRPRRFSLTTSQRRGSSIGKWTMFYPTDSQTRRAQAKIARRASIEAERIEWEASA